MPSPEHYFEAFGWYFPIDKQCAAAMPARSVFMLPGPAGPGGGAGPEWELGDIPPRFATSRSEPNVQGWKLHVSCHPEDVESLFHALAGLLHREEIAHKFCDFARYSRGDQDRACCVYPADPPRLQALVPLIDHVLREAISGHALKEGAETAYLRPRDGGVRGDLPLGRTGFVSCRYGGFQGRITQLGSRDLQGEPTGMIYDNVRDQLVQEIPRRMFKPVFISMIPIEILGVMARG